MRYFTGSRVVLRHCPHHHKYHRRQHHNVVANAQDVDHTMGPWHHNALSNRRHGVFTVHNAVVVVWKQSSPTSSSSQVPFSSTSKQRFSSQCHPHLHQQCNLSTNPMASSWVPSQSHAAPMIPCRRRHHRRGFRRSHNLLRGWAHTRFGGIGINCSYCIRASRTPRLGQNC